MTSGIYTIRHRESGKTYIGRSVDIAGRWSQHRYSARVRRNNTPIENALRKYGADAFDWKTIISAPARLHAILERQFIDDRGTWAPNGYNVGGTVGGFLSVEIRDTLPLEEREHRRALTVEASNRGAQALREKRKDPAYDVEFLAMRHKAGLVREANIREKCAADPEYAARIKAQKSKATLSRKEGYQHKGALAFKKRMASDLVFAAKVKANRQRAAALSAVARKKNANLS